MTTKFSVILLAGGVGARMNMPIPKQFIHLNGKPIAKHSFDLFANFPGTLEIIVVCTPDYRHEFKAPPHLSVKFANPGERRQDSLYNGLQQIDHAAKIVCVHDAARPYITHGMINRVIEAAQQFGAATVGMPVKFTVKESNSEGFVKATLDRSRFWEIQTPQAISTPLLKEGFAKVIQENRTVTDDVSLVEMLNLPVKLVEGSYENIKITTKEDLA